MRLYFLPTLSKYRLLLSIDVFLIWLVGFFHVIHMDPIQHWGTPLPREQECLGWRHLLLQLFSEVFKTQSLNAHLFSSVFGCPGWGGLSQMSGCIPVQCVWLQSQAVLQPGCPTGSSVGAEPQMPWFPLLREVRPKKASVCWYSAMQIYAVGCAHTSALIHCSRLSLSFRTLVC